MQMVVQDLVEALQAHAFSFFLFVLADSFSAPNTLDHEGRFYFCLSVVHASDVTHSTLNLR